MIFPRVGVLLVFACLTASCSVFDGDRQPRREPPDRQPQANPMRKIFDIYDLNHDGALTRSELEAGLRVDFAKADLNHDGHLDADEMRVVNQQRWENDASMASPLVDWNQDGIIDLTEFGATARSLFAQYDRDGDGVITAEDLHIARPGQPKATPMEVPHERPRPPRQPQS